MNRIVLDTETCPLNTEETTVSPTNMLVYDIGWLIVDEDGIVKKTRSYIVAEVFLNEKLLMNSAYYSKKIPQYWEDIKNGSRVLTSFYNIREQLKEDCENYRVMEIFAHNMVFDFTALNNTQRWLTKSKYRYFFPRDLVIKDTLKYANGTIAKTEEYKNFCVENGFLTKHKTPRPRATAEILYKYIMCQLDFEESHTSLEDSQIEKTILMVCLSLNPDFDCRLYKN